MERASSLPPTLQVNPFWSRRVQEVGLRQLRPMNLPPVPGDDAEVERELDGEVEQPISDQVGRGGRGKGRPRSPDRFRTPASWAEGRSAAASLGGDGRAVGEQSEGIMPEVERDEPSSLERELEREMVMRLHQENLLLKQEIEVMQQARVSKATSSSWSAVTPDDGGHLEQRDGGLPVPPPPQRSRSPSRRSRVGDGSKFTPNGTRVPDGPPPQTLPDLPAWPFDGYDRTDVKGPCPMSLGQCWQGLPCDPDPRRGMESRQEGRDRAKELGRGASPRQEHHEGFCVGMAAGRDPDRNKDMKKCWMLQPQGQHGWKENFGAYKMRWNAMDIVEDIPGSMDPIGPRASAMVLTWEIRVALLMAGVITNILVEIAVIGLKGITVEIAVIGLKGITVEIAVIGLASILDENAVIGLTNNVVEIKVPEYQVTWTSRTPRIT